MWRFILVTFAFLGWSFYELSGGADYTPRTNSIQARAVLDDVRPVARPVRTHVAQIAATGGVAPAIDPAPNKTASRTSAPGQDSGAQTGVTLASATASDLAAAAIGQPVITASPVAQPRITGLTLRGLSDTVRLDTGRLDTMHLDTGPSAPSTPSAPVRDLRSISGNAVNMRAGPGTQYDRIARLTRGQQVAVLQDPGNGWLKLRVLGTGRVGWMAGSLVTASAN